MAFEQNLQCVSVPAGSDLSTKQYLFVNVNSSSQLAVSGAGGQGIGVLQDKPNAAGVAGNVAIGGISKVVAGGTVTAGSLVAADSAGKAVNAASGDIALGKAITGTTTSGEIVSIIVMPQVGKIW